MSERPILECLDGVTYIIDLAGRITDYGKRHWTDFAGSNGAPELCDPANVIGLELLSVIQGDEVRDAYQRLIEEALKGERDGFAFGFRCDSPSTKREMRMAIAPIRMSSQVTGVLVQSIVLRSNTRPPLNIFEFRELSKLIGESEGRPIVTICSYCANIRDRSGQISDADWVTAEEYYQMGGISDVLISHGACPDCSERMLRLLD